ncbi:MAG: peptidoglycan editing factor PgeF [Gammaproteobacteria bacterium]|nr:MAG: peptidoglycan editing factor PgeF [Gammaproteobacteria bacterium]
MDKTYIVPEWPAPKNVRACITTRAGGVSLAPYASNNFGTHVGDNLAAVESNRKVLCESLGLKKSPQWLEQVHGVKVVNAKDDKLVRTADACFSTDIGQACVAMTADCLPIFLCDRKGIQVAVLHCGWRSLAKGICAKALQKFNSAPEQLMAYLGPAISQKYFEVGVDVLEAFFKSARTPSHADAIASAFISGRRPLHFHADIYELARAELKSLGVNAIYGGEYCTYEQSEKFYSYRRDGVTGRMAHVIWLE